MSMNYTVTQVCPSWTTNSYPDLVDQVYKPLSNIQDLLPNYSSLYLRVRQDQIFVVNQGKEMLLKDSSHSDSNRIQTSANQILQLAGYHSRPSYYPHSPIYCQKVEQFNPKDLSSEIATLKQKIALLQQKLYEPNSAELNALREENSILQSQLKEAQKSLQGLRSELEQVKTSTTKDLTALQSEYQASVATLSKTFEKNLIANEKRIEELNRQITEKEQANARAQSSIETLESDKEELRHQLELAKTENSTLVQEHEENLALAKSEYLKALRQLELKQGQTLDEFMATLIAPLNQKLEAANKRIQDLEIQITESKRTSAENTQLKESLAKVEEEKADLQRRIAELPDKATDVVKANQEVIAIQAKLAKAQQKISKQEELLELAKTDYDQRLNELEKQATAQINEFKETNIAHYEERISALQTELKKAEAAKAEALEQIHSQRTSELEAEIKKQAAVLTKLKNDIAIYEEEHKQKAAVKKEVIDRFSEYRFDYLTDKGKALLDRQA
ncbi:MAG: hypothetical protein FJZ56_06795, partial [Chlamydiae bacterium]|nr:hypothetical protein [Chlamydiota bacterium]